jgi:hypothetical protein
MSRSKSRHKRTAAKVPEKMPEEAPQGLRRSHVVLLIVAFFGLSLIAWLWWNSKQADSGFQQQIAEGQSALTRVRSFPSEGLEQHVPQGSSVYYRTAPPNAGAHYPTPSNPGYYETLQPPGNLVHALEHGHIVIYYDRTSSDAMQSLKDWANRFQDRWAGVIVTPMPGIGQEIILTAWAKDLRLGKFDAAAAAAFIDRFRGRGPEHPVR